jgi:hypothetical protein
VLRTLQGGPALVDAFDPRIVAGLVADGLIAITGTTVNLPR